MSLQGRFLKVAAAICIAAGMVFGAPVSFETAQNVAQKHLDLKHGGKIKQTAAPKTRAFVPYFVFEKENGGFIIISADDVALPILGETDSGTFDKDSMPPALIWLLGTYEEQIKEAVDNGLTQDSATKVLWEQVVQNSNQKRGSIRAVTYPDSLIFAKWNQGSPYNLLAPKDGQSLSLTGCVATAMAQIMKYWQYPANGTGTIATYTTNTKKLNVPAVNLNVNYDYANMLNTYGNTATQLQKDAVATLMYHCGVSMKMDYQASSSSASQDITSAMKTNFGYDNCIKYVWSKASATINENDWKDLIIGQIENNSPVFYTGVDEKSGGGHAFIIDGYRSSTGDFHLNWGWGGQSNGFYAINAAAFPTSQQSYNKDQGMVMNIMPNKNGNAPSQIKVSTFTVSPTSTAISANIRAKMNYGVDFSGQIGFAIVSETGSVIKVLDSAAYSITNTYQTGGRYTVNYKDANLSKQIGADIPSGLLTLQVVTKTSGGVWTPVGETQTVSITAPVPSKLYKITFNANGGAVAQESATTGTDGKLTSLPTPSRNGYSFDGWFTTNETSGGTQITTSTVFSGDATVYARWTLVPIVSYSITLNANGGAVAQESATTGTDGKLISLPTPSRNGYAFNGWFTSETGGSQITVNTVFNKDATVYARWTLINYTVTFNLNDGLGTTLARITVNIENSPEGTLKESQKPTGVFTKDGFDNDGNWYTRTGSSPNYTYKEFVFGDGGTKVTGNVTLYLQWKSTYNVVFVDDIDGDTIATIKTKFHGKLDYLPEEPEKENHNFDGWFTKISDEEEVEVTENTVFNAHAHVYAKFTAATPIAVIKKSDGRTGIRLYNNVVSDNAKFVVVLPNDERISQIKIVIYDNVGNVVFETTQKGVIEWDLTNSAGRSVANGSYLIVAEVKGSGGNAYIYSAKVGVKR